MPHEIRCDVVSSDLLERLASAPFPIPVPASDLKRGFYRELYLDTSDDLLQRRGVLCRLRIAPSGDAELLVAISSKVRGRDKTLRYSAALPSADVRAALSSATEPIKHVAAITDPRQLEVRVELDVEAQTRFGGRDLLRRHSAAAHFERVKVRTTGATRTFHQLRLESLRGDGGLAGKLAEAYSTEHGLRVAAADMRERAQLLLKWIESEERTRPTRSAGGVALIVTNGNSIGLLERDGAVLLPSSVGAGVGSARALLGDFAGSDGGDPRLVGTLNCIGERSKLEVWATELRDSAPSAGKLSWLPLEKALSRAAASATPDADTLSALALVFRSGVIRSAFASQSAAAPAASRMDSDLAALSDTAREWRVQSERHFLNSEISLLDFNTRVLALAEDLDTPLVERFRFLSIVSANIDEFFMVRVAALKQLALESPEELGTNELEPQEQLELIASHCSALVARQYRCFDACMTELAAHGTRIRGWNELADAEKAELREYFREEIFSSLTPMAMTMSAGHPFPRLPHLSLSLAVVLLDARGGAPHFAHVELPTDLPRFREAGNSGGVIRTEEIIRANLDLLYPRLEIEQSFLFRVTRGADISVDEDNAWSLLHAVDEATKARFEKPVVRVEVEAAMPAVIRELVLKQLQRENGGSLSSADIYEIPGLIDLTALSQLDLPASPRLRFPKLETKDPFADCETVWECIRTRDRLVRHPFDAFGTTVVRFFEEAAADENVVAIKATLYRAGDDSPIIAALIAAARAGKDVVAFVELKARFEEERNVGWAKKLQEAGGKMVLGFKGLKTHAKTAMVVRRENGKLRQYVHVGTGNYNAQTAKQYTDLSLFSADPELAGDIHDLFNELTGSATAPQPLSRGCLIAPQQLLPAMLERIEREAAHARAGKVGLIRLKLNGLSDPDVIDALYRASQDGVRVDLVVRGICTLRPGVPGLSERITVASVVGRFLEHERIYHFANSGSDEYFIGSPDFRPRNLRRRIELIAPVREADARAELNLILNLYLNDATGWQLTGTGEYVRRSTMGVTGPSAQQIFQ